MHGQQMTAESSARGREPLTDPQTYKYKFLSIHVAVVIRTSTVVQIKTKHAMTMGRLCHCDCNRTDTHSALMVPPAKEKGL